MVWREVGNVLRERGWCKEEFESKDGRVCLLGACGLAWHDDAGFAFSYAPLLQKNWAALQHLQHLADTIDPNSATYRAIFAFNDDPDRTIEDVLALVDRLTDEEESTR